MNRPKTIRSRHLLRWLRQITFLVSPLIFLLPLRLQLAANSRLDEIFNGSFATNTAEEHAGSELTLVSWNIERGVKQSQILKALAGPLSADLLALQEVDLNTRRTEFQNVAAVVARHLRINYVFGIEFEELAQERRNKPAFHGQALLCRFQIARARVLRFSNQPHNWGGRWKPRWAWLQPRKGGRMALIGEFHWDNRLCVIYNVHLESRTNDSRRARQMREVVNDIQENYLQETPVIVAGDFNVRDGKNSSIVRQIKAAGFHDVLRDWDGPPGTKVRSKKYFDWIFVRNLIFCNGSIPRLAISDHYPLMVRLSLPPAKKKLSP